MIARCISCPPFSRPSSGSVPPGYDCRAPEPLSPVRRTVRPGLSRLSRYSGDGGGWMSNCSVPRCWRGRKETVTSAVDSVPTVNSRYPSAPVSSGIGPPSSDSDRPETRTVAPPTGAPSVVTTSTRTVAGRSADSASTCRGSGLTVSSVRSARSTLSAIGTSSENAAMPTVTATTSRIGIPSTARSSAQNGLDTRRVVPFRYLNARTSVN